MQGLQAERRKKERTSFLRSEVTCQTTARRPAAGVDGPWQCARPGDHSMCQGLDPAKAPATLTPAELPLRTARLGLPQPPAAPPPMLRPLLRSGPSAVCAAQSHPLRQHTYKTASMLQEFAGGLAGMPCALQWRAPLTPPLGELVQQRLKSNRSVRHLPSLPSRCLAQSAATAGRMRCTVLLQGS